MRTYWLKHLICVGIWTGFVAPSELNREILTNIYSLLALSQAASFYKLTRPLMTTENIIKINGGR